MASGRRLASGQRDKIIDFLHFQVRTMMMLSFPLPLTMILSLYVCVRAQVDRSVVG